jgi:hypothetical protein
MFCGCVTAQGSSQESMLIGGLGDLPSYMSPGTPKAIVLTKAAQLWSCTTAKSLDQHCTPYVKALVTATMFGLFNGMEKSQVLSNTSSWCFIDFGATPFSRHRLVVITSRSAFSL